MATRSLGTLTLDLIAKIGGFVAGMTEAERQADKSQRSIAAKAKQRAKQTSDEWSAATRLITAGFAGITIVGLFDKFTKETLEAQNAQAQLVAVLKSTGNAAGFTQQQLNGMADRLSSIIPNSESITQAQATLLKYTNVVGDQFVKALELAGDMSARTGEDIKSSADTIGKALNTPAEGLAKLRKFGIEFSEAQEKGLQILVDTGRAAEAQAVILDALQRSYGGAAEAARNTFGGSLTALQEAFNDLLTGDDGSVTGLRDGIESLTKTLKSPEIKDGFAALVSGLATVIEFSAKAVAGLVNFATFLGEHFARAVNGSADPLERLDENIQSLRGNIELLNRGLAQSKPGTESYKQQESAVAQLNKELAQAVKLREQLVREAFAPAPRPQAAAVAAGGPTRAELEALAAQKKAQEEARKNAESAIKAADAYIKRLRDQLAATQELTVVQKVQQDLQVGALIGATKAQREQLFLFAKQIDDEKAWQEFKKKTLDLYKEEAAEVQRLNALRVKGREFAKDAIVSQDPIVALKAQLDERKALLAEYAANDQESALLYAEAAVVLERQTQERMTQILQDQAAQREALRKAEQDKFLNAATTFFGNLEQLQGSSSEKLARIGKAAAIANAIVKTYESATSSYAALAGIPIVGPALGAAAAAAAIAAGLANVQAIRSQGRAAGGPVTGDQMYTVGERGPELFVPQQSGFIVPNQLLSKDGGGAGSAQVNQRIVNVIDPAMVGDFLGTPEGEQVLVNVIRRNSDSLRAVVNNA